MKKMSLTLLAAGVLAAAAGMAQAETLVLSGHQVVTTQTPDGQRTYWIDTPVMVGPNIPGAMPVATLDSTPLATIDSSQVLATGPVVTTTDTTVLGAGPVLVPESQSTYVQPGWSGDYHQRHQAAGTFNVPARAGEASTMTNGQPNALTDNNAISHDVYVPVYTTP